jgi:AbiV family abortive infection protein
MDEAVETIIANAERLLVDARTLADAEAYRTATALCILSFEESGKACLVYWQKAGFISDAIEQLRLHNDKQRIFIAYRTIVAINKIGKLVPTEDSAEAIDFSDPAAFNAFQQVYYQHTGQDVASTNAGLDDYFKEHGFYTDIGDDLNLVQSLIPFERSTFDRYADRAVEALQMAKSPRDVQHQMAAVHASGAHPRLPAKTRKEFRKEVLQIVERLLTTGSIHPREAP